MVGDVWQISWDHQGNKTIFVRAHCEVCHFARNLEIVNAKSNTLHAEAQKVFAEFHDEEDCYREHQKQVR